MPGRSIFLSQLTALDLTGEMGFLAGRILADLGARVIKVEPPGGLSARQSGPFTTQAKGQRLSLTWLAYNHNKESVTLDITRPEGKMLFERLAAKADFVLESFQPGHLDRLGLGYKSLRKTNPRIILTSITGFGQTGPYHDYRFSDLTLMAMGGVMSLIGDPDRPPVRITVEQAAAHGCAQAAVGTLVAHAARARSGEGCHVDCSIQESLVLLLGSSVPAWEVSRQTFKREGSRMVTNISRRAIYPCKDGHVAFLLNFGRNAAPFMTPMVQWLREEGMAGALANVDLAATKMEQITKEMLAEYEDIFLRFFATKTKREILEQAVKRRLLADPITTVADIYQDPQLKARGFFESVRHSDLQRDLVHPGSFARALNGAGAAPTPAPAPGQHNVAVFQDMLGLTPREIGQLQAQGVV